MTICTNNKLSSEFNSFRVNILHIIIALLLHYYITQYSAASKCCAKVQNANKKRRLRSVIVYNDYTREDGVGWQVVEALDILSGTYQLRV